jgi:Ca2+-binding RTX toxin-like protein
MGTGTLGILDLLDLKGEFRFEISTTKVDVFVGATVVLGPFGSAGVSGNFQLSTNGAAGALSIAVSAGISGAGIALSGVMQLEFNTGPNSATVRTLDISPVTGAVTGFNNVTLPGTSVRTVIGGSLKIADTFEIFGRVDMAFSAGGFNLEFNGTLNLAGFDAVSVSGAGQIRNGVFAAYTSMGVNAISIPSVDISGNFTLEVNTGSDSVAIGGRTIAGTTCRIIIGAQIRVLGFKLYGEVNLGLKNGVFEIELKDLNLNFFNVVTITVNGYVRSNGEFSIAGELGFTLDLGPFDLSGGVGVRLTNTSLAGWIYGSVNFTIDFGFFSETFTLASLRADFEIGYYSASASLEVSVAGTSMRGSIGWSWGSPPPIARKEGDTLYLNIGVDGYRRGSDFSDVTNETYSILKGESDDSVIVYSLGAEEKYSGIKHISVPDAAAGKDYIYVAPSVTATVDAHGGDGNDTFYFAGSGRAIVYGDAGNDRLYGGSGNDELYGGAGFDNLYGQGGNDTLDGAADADFIEGNTGNDTIRGGDGGDEIYGNEGDDTISGGAGDDYINAGAGDNTITGDDGNDQILAEGGKDTIAGGAGDDDIDAGIGDNIISGNDGNDHILAGTGKDTITGGAGDDDIDAGAGDNTITGDDGNDYVLAVYGNDTIAGGAGDDDIDAGAGDNTITGDDGNDHIVAEDGNDTITGGAGDDYIDAGAGDDTIPSVAGSDNIYAGAGADNITINLTTGIANATVLGNEGTDTVNVTIASGGFGMLLAGHTFSLNGSSVTFNDTTDIIRLTDTTATTRLTTSTASSMDFGSIEFAVTGTTLDVSAATLRIPTGTIRLKGQSLVGTLNTELGSLSVSVASFSTGGDIVVREKDDLNLIDQGLQTGFGLIDVQLAAPKSTLVLQGGSILAGGSGKPITLVADDMDLAAGENTVVGTGTLAIRSLSAARNYNIGSAGETTAGGDLTFGTDNDALNLSMIDVAAISDNFTSVSIGHRNTGNVMFLGDAQDQTSVKYTKAARTVNAALRNNTSFVAEKINVVGAVEATADTLTLTSRLLNINSRNLHVPMGDPDSGLTAARIILTVDEQLQVSGWIKGTSLVQIHVTGSTGTNAISTFSDGINSITTDITSVIQTLAAASRIEIVTSASVRNAGLIEAQGTGAVLNISGGTSLRNMEGGSLTAPGSNSSVVLTGSGSLWANSGSAIMAGVRFNTINGAPVPEVIGTAASISMNFPGEMLLSGSVTSAAGMNISGGPRGVDYAEYFDTLPGAILAETSPLTTYTSELKARRFPESLRPVLTTAKLTLGSTVSVSTLETDKRWLISDSTGNSYVLLLSDPENDGVPNTLQVLKRHYLIGQRGFSLLVTGTITVMEGNQSLTMQGGDDVIIRGNINVKGQNGNLVLQSDKRIYWEGAASVTNNLSFYGGLEIDGTDRSGADSSGSSIYLDPTSSLVTSQAGSDILFRGSKDIDLLGALVAGGSVGENGVTWAGADSTISVIAGQQIYVDSGLQAAGSVSVQAGTPGSDDSGLSVVITTAGGITAAGQTSTSTGATAVISGGGDLQIMGSVLSGGSVTQQFNASGDRVGETYTWSTKKSTISVTAGGQAWIGGMALNTSNQLVETGGFLNTTESITITGGINSSGIGVRVSGASQIMAVNPAASILVDSTGDADIQGYLLAGGLISRTYDAAGQYLGRTATTYDGDSSIRIMADNQIRVGTNLQAGKLVELTGGLDPVEAGVAYSGNGILLYGSVQISTWRPSSEIRVNGPGRVSLLAPDHSQEIKADSFITTANGRLASDVTLNLWLDKIGWEITSSVKVLASSTTTNTSIQDLMADIQNAINSAQWAVTKSDNASHPVGSAYTTSGAVKDLEVSLSDSRLLLVSPYEFELRSTSVNATALGWSTLSTGSIASTLPYTLYAPQTDSVISIGAPTGPNGKLSIAGKVLADKAINLYSGEEADGVSLDLTVTGLLETRHGSINLSPGATSVMMGDVIAGGAGSDISVTASKTLELRGNLWADNNVIVNAGTTPLAGTDSLRTYGTSSIKTLSGGTITLTSVNNLSIDSQIGPGSTGLTSILLQSTYGSVIVQKTSGRIETGTSLTFSGNDVEIAGVVSSTLATPSTTDYEVTIDIAGKATLHGDIQLAGSLLVDAAQIAIYDQNLRLTAPAQRLVLNSAGAVTFGQTNTLANGTLQQLGAVVSVPSLTIAATGKLTVGSGSVLATSLSGSAMQIDAASAEIVGSIYAGATLAVSGAPTWVSAGIAELRISGDAVIGGMGVSDSGTAVTRGGNLQAASDLSIVTGGILTVNSLSALKVDATGGGLLTAVTPGQLNLTADSGLRLQGLLQTVDPGSSVHLNTTQQMEINGLIDAAGSVVAAAATYSQGPAIVVMPLILKTDSQGRLIDENGRLIDEDGFLINSAGKYVDASGNVLTVPPATPVFGGNPVRLSGGEIHTGAGGTISLSASG